MGPDTEEIVQLLREVAAGREGALDRLVEIIYADLRRLAQKHIRRQFGSKAGLITLEPTALVHETFLRLIKQRNTYDNLGHFFAIATRVMLRVLTDYHRQRLAAKRGGGQTRVSLSGIDDKEPMPETSEAPALVDALERLERLDVRGAEIVKLRILWGLTLPEIATTLAVSQSTVEREWRFARRWLSTELAAKA